MADRRALQLYVYLAAGFVAALIIANVLAVKILGVGPFVVPAGVLAYSITFAITDVVCEIWGKPRTQVLVNAGFAVQLGVWALIQLAIALPPASFWPNQQAYATVLGSTNRIIVASLIAYLVSQSLDVWLYNAIKRRWGTPRLWFRNNLATIVSQTIDTGLFITLAFWGTGVPLLQLILGQLVVKYVIALCDTPFVYLGVYLVRLRLRLRPGEALADAGP